MAGALGLLAIIVAAIFSGSVEEPDRAGVLRLNQLLAIDAVSTLLFVVTQLGTEFLWLGVAVVLAVRAGGRNRHAAVALVIAIIVTDLALFVVKSLSYRRRPDRIFPNPPLALRHRNR